ncbi:unnamed protein product [Callosobruchus maculatus]|uniref:Uncharacterized protein n=1 Tax=Callosobruchus maculatus TaxID=64391 RepID=A0A653CZI4_CALMS|nr:unnamed protein product [Callosobruchus maculatus]
MLKSGNHGVRRLPGEKHLQDLRFLNFSEVKVLQLNTRVMIFHWKKCLSFETCTLLKNTIEDKTNIINHGTSKVVITSALMATLCTMIKQTLTKTMAQ